MSIFHSFYMSRMNQQKGCAYHSRSGTQAEGKSILTRASEINKVEKEKSGKQGTGSKTFPHKMITVYLSMLWPRLAL